MADHDVYFTIPERDLGRADVKFRVKRNGKAFGRLRVSEGSVDWLPANKQKPYRVYWTELDKYARDHGH